MKKTSIICASIILSAIGEHATYAQNAAALPASSSFCLPENAELIAKSDSPSDDAKLCEAIARLRSVPAGREVLNIAKRENTRVVSATDGNGAGFLTGDGIVRISTKISLESIAIVLGHEFEHVRQFSDFHMPRRNSFTAQWGATLRQYQVWAELGFPSSYSNELFRIWKFHPKAARWLYWRGQFYQAQDAEKNIKSGQLRLSEDYLKKRETEFALWLSGNKNIFEKQQTDFAGGTGAQFKLYFDGAIQMSQAIDRANGDWGAIGHAGGDFSDAFVDFLEQALQTPVGGDLALAAPPTTRELEALSYFPVELGIYQREDGRWFARRGDENSAKTDDLKGKACILIHNHPSNPDVAAQGLKARDNFPSHYDFIDNDGQLEFLILPLGLLRYDRPDLIKDPMTGQQAWRPASAHEFYERSWQAQQDRTSWYERQRRKNRGKKGDFVGYYSLLGFTIELAGWDKAVAPACPNPRPSAVIGPISEAENKIKELLQNTSRSLNAL